MNHAADWSLTPDEAQRITELAYMYRQWRVWKSRAWGSQPGAWYASYLGTDPGMPRTLDSNTLEGLAEQLADPMAYSIIAY